MNVIEYKTLNDDHTEYNSWKSEESFPIKRVEKGVLGQLDDYEILEYIFEGMQSKRSQESFSRLIALFEKEIIDIFRKDKKRKYLFAIEHSSEVISRVRTYKGLVEKKKIKIDEFVQKEFMISEKESRIAFVAQLNESNFSYLLKFFFDSSSSFVISSEQNYLNENFLEKVTGLFNLKGWTDINFLNVMLEFCCSGDFVYRIGGNNGEHYWSLQILKSKAF